MKLNNKYAHLSSLNFDKKNQFFFWQNLKILVHYNLNYIYILTLSSQFSIPKTYKFIYSKLNQKYMYAIGEI